MGREVVRGLQERGAEVRAMSRAPESADLPDGVEVVRGDMTDPASLRDALEGVEAAHLITFDAAARGAGGGEAIADAAGVVDALIDAGVRRVTVLQNGYPGPIEDAVGEAPFEAGSGSTATRPRSATPSRRPCRTSPVAPAGRSPSGAREHAEAFRA